jgi:arylsulfatase A-like enzyme
MSTRTKLATAALAAVAVGVPVALSTSTAAAARHKEIQHVLLISVDGLHQSDLEWYVNGHPNSTLAKLERGGAEFSKASTSVPSDSDPGGTALMTGGDPRSTGIYYDVEYSHAVFPPGTPSNGCSGPVPGGNVIYDSPDDTVNAVPDLLNNGSGNTFPAFDENGSIYPGTLANPFPGWDTNPGAIMDLQFSGPTAVNPSLNSSTFPVDPATCQPIQPWDYLGVNTIFQVIKNAGGLTAWSDKHAVYSSFNGPGSNGQSIDDLFSPEIDSQAVEPNGVPYPQDDDWAHIDAATKQYDGYKVQAVINEIDGFDHSRTTHPGVPEILGMNFQAVSVAEKVDSPGTITQNPDGTYTVGPKELAGYLPGTTTPGPLLSGALDYVNAQITRMVDEIKAQGLTSSTAIIITAKHGQSPQDPLLLKRIQDGPIIDKINQAWCVQENPAGLPTPASYCMTGLGNGTITPLIVAGTDDDLWQSYLSINRVTSPTDAQVAADFVANYLWNYTATAKLYSNDGVMRGTMPVKHSGLAQVYAGRDAAAFFGVPYQNANYPDVFGRVQVGVVYTGGSKIAEHGGNNPGDTNVPILVYSPTVKAASSAQPVETTQVAPTILQLLGLSPNSLQAVQQEGTQVLPGIG